MLESDNPPQKYLCLNRFWLKVLAGLFMTVDHISLFFVSSTAYPVAFQVLRAIGRLAFPLFAFLALEGFNKSSNPLKYALRLIAYGLGMDLAVYLYGLIIHESLYNAIYVGNAVTELGLGVLIMVLLERKDPYSLLAVFPMAYMILSDFPSFFPLRSEYGTFGLLILMALYLSSKAAKAYENSLALKAGLTSEDISQASGRWIKNCFAAAAIFLCYVFLLFIQHLDSSSFLFINIDVGPALESYGVLSLLFVLFYSGRKGFSNKPVKVTFYLYYPLHAIIMFLIWKLLI